METGNLALGSINTLIGQLLCLRSEGAILTNEVRVPAGGAEPMRTLEDKRDADEVLEDEMEASDEEWDLLTIWRGGVEGLSCQPLPLTEAFPPETAARRDPGALVSGSIDLPEASPPNRLVCTEMTLPKP